MRRGEKITRPQWIGFSFAVLGLLALLLPGASAPPVFESLFMMVAGVSWGYYSALDRESRDGLRNTASNFVLAAVAAAAVTLITLITLITPHARLLSDSGIALAALAGSLTSGVGYAFWYAVLPKLRASTAAFAQLTVPVIPSGQQRDIHGGERESAPAHREHRDTRGNGPNRLWMVLAVSIIRTSR